MRLWSLHPKYLDSKGLVAVWREGLLAKNVLEEKTSGYVNHPQLMRFRNHPFPLLAINTYLYYVLTESRERNYNFDENKLDKLEKHLDKIKVNSGQIEYEFTHLKKKLAKRDLDLYNQLIVVKKIETHPLFELKQGEIEVWEKV